MLFVPEIGSYIEYLELRTSFHKSKKDRLRQNIFESNNNKIVFNKDFVNSIEETIDEKHPLRDESNLFIKRMIDNLDDISINANTNSGTGDPDIIFEDLCKINFKGEILIGVSESKENIGDFQKILNLDNVSPDNKNHILSKLLTGEVCQIRHADLNQLSDIIPLLNLVYDLYSDYEKISIIDRQVNLNHNLYNLLITKSPHVDYFSLNVDASDNQALKSKFRKYQFYSTRDKNLIHERILIIKDVIITMDEDPMFIEQRNTWTITIETSKRLANRIYTDKRNQFIKTLYNKS